MTSGLFYECCKAGYIANDYEGSNTLSGKELYLKHADGRDEGLRDIDENSPEAFRQWLKNRNQSGHPWEVFPGGNSTHVSLFVCKNENGFSCFLDLSNVIKQILDLSCNFHFQISNFNALI